MIPTKASFYVIKSNPQPTRYDILFSRFPRAGTPNAKSILKLVTFKLEKAPLNQTVLDFYQEGQSGMSSQCMYIYKLQTLKKAENEVF